MHNHNALLGQVKGVDGIKSGYTEASGYNLVSSVRRDDKHIVAVILGGTSNAARDARMRQLIEVNISLASTHRTVQVIVEANGQQSASREWARYLAAQRLKDDRWRYQSPSRIARFYGDLGWKGTPVVGPNARGSLRSCKSMLDRSPTNSPLRRRNQYTNRLLAGRPVLTET